MNNYNQLRRRDCKSTPKHGTIQRVRKRDASRFSIFPRRSRSFDENIENPWRTQRKCDASWCRRLRKTKFNQTCFFYRRIQFLSNRFNAVIY